MILPDTPFTQLFLNLRTADEVYKAAVYGALHNETQIIQILGKMGLESSEQTLEKSRYKHVSEVLNAFAEKEEKIDIDFSKNQIVLIRKALKVQLKVVKNVPQLAREQLVITYCTLLEGFVNDTIKGFLQKYPQSLKSNKSSLKDAQLIDSILEGNTLEKLIDFRVREIMYDSISGWLDYLNDKGLNISQDEHIKEMFLIRNVLIHNNKKVGNELAKFNQNKRYKLYKTVNVTESDVKRFSKAIDRISKNINAEYSKKNKR